MPASPMRAAIAAMHQALGASPASLADRLLQGIEDEVRAQRGRDGPADNPPREDVDDDHSWGPAVSAAMLQD
jgi:hypothetical protein